MFEIKYTLSNNDFHKFSNPSITDLRYNHFLGSIELCTENDSIRFDWDWIPIIDFALSTMDISKKLLTKMTAQEEFCFTESDSKITFQKNVEEIFIISSFSGETLKTNWSNLKKGIENFYKAVVLDIYKSNRQLESNSMFLTYVREAESI